MTFNIHCSTPSQTKAVLVAALKKDGAQNIGVKPVTGGYVVSYTVNAA